VRAAVVVGPSVAPSAEAIKRQPSDHPQRRTTTPTPRRTAYVLFIGLSNQKNRRNPGYRGSVGVDRRPTNRSPEAANQSPYLDYLPEQLVDCMF